MSRLFARAAFYPTLLWNVTAARVLRVWNWWDAVDDQLLLGALPFRCDVAKLHDAGVRAVVNMCEEYAGPIQAYARYGIEQLHLPVVDFTEPSLEAVNAAIDFIDRQRAAGGAVYVHCKAGRGRSATIVLCWLMRSHKITPEAAQALLQSKRRQVARDLASRQVVREYWEQLRPSWPE